MKTNFRQAKEFMNNTYDTSNVPLGITYWQRQLISKCQNLFHYKNLPDTLNSWEIEKNLIIKGNGAIIKKNGKLYIPFTGSVYGYDEYYVPNQFTFAQPILGSGSYYDYKNCAIIWNTEFDKIDYSTSQIFQIIQRYSRMLADIESTFHSILVAQRAGRLGIAQNSSVAQAVDEVMSKLEIGDTKTIVNSSMQLETFKPLAFVPTGNLSDFTQARDYLINCFYNEIGLQTLENKKERMITDELSADNDVLGNNIECMYNMRMKNVEKINEVFGLDIELQVNPTLGGLGNSADTDEIGDDE